MIRHPPKISLSRVFYGTGVRIKSESLSELARNTRNACNLHFAALQFDHEECLVSQLPPELLRKGRFDELWFVDLPNQQERESIWRIQTDKICGTYLSQTGCFNRYSCFLLGELHGCTHLPQEIVPHSQRA